MECAESLALLSEYRDHTLAEVKSTEVRTHLQSCGPCTQVSNDLVQVIIAAKCLPRAPSPHEVAAAAGDVVSYPDEDALWQRINPCAHAPH